jgi:hypothetical protein
MVDRINKKPDFEKLFYSITTGELQPCAFNLCVASIIADACNRNLSDDLKVHEMNRIQQDSKNEITCNTIRRIKRLRDLILNLFFLRSKIQG